MMETISITNRGSIRKFVDDVFIDTIENIYALCDLKISKIHLRMNTYYLSILVNF